MRFTHLMLFSGGIMHRENREISKIDKDIKSAGQTFLGFRMEDLLLRADELDNKELKKQLIMEYFKYQIGTFDLKISGTNTRVNSAIRIIKADKVLYALKKIDGSNPKVVPDAVLKAKDTIRKIECGELALPNLE